MSERRIHDALPGATYKGFASASPPRSPEAPQAAPMRRRRGVGRASAGALGVAVGLLVAGVSAGLIARPRPAPRAEALVVEAPSLPPYVAAEPATPPPPPAIRNPPPVRSAPARRAAPTVRARPRVERTAQAATRPAFHCDWRLRPSEKMVCADATLAQLDRQLNHAYGQALRAGVPRAQLRREQDAWVFRREAAARRSRAALVSYYNRRIDQLEALARRRGR